MDNETPSETVVGRRWPFHPKNLGLAIALICFPAAILSAPIEQTIAAEFVPYISALRTVLAFFGGAGFTAWLSMSTYEYIHEKSQRREWDRQFALEKVREFYGPLYDELQSNLLLLRRDFTTLHTNAVSFFKTRYISLLVPSALIKKGKVLSDAVMNYNDQYAALFGKLTEIVQGFTNAWIEDNRGMADDGVFSGAEARYILGRTHVGFEQSYARFLRKTDIALHTIRLKISESPSEMSLPETTVSGNIKEFDKELRAIVLSSLEATKLLGMCTQIETATSDVIRELVPLVKAPYE